MTESGLGGVLHLLQLPFSGVLLTGISICVLCLIFQYSDNKLKQMSESLLLVLLIKYTIGPHTSPTAAFAVSFQCLSSYIFYSIFSVSWFSILLVSVLTFLESAFQKVLVLYIIYGKELSNIINEFVQKISINWMNIGNLTSSESILLYYTLIYFLSAVLTSFLINRLYQSIIFGDKNLFSNLSIKEFAPLELSTIQNRKIKGKFLGLIILFLLILSIGIFSGYSNLTYIFIRSIFVIILWIFIILPMGNFLIKRILNKRKDLYQLKLVELQLLFPRIKIAYYWAINQSDSLPWYKKFFQIPYYLLGFTLFARE